MSNLDQPNAPVCSGNLVRPWHHAVKVNPASRRYARGGEEVERLEHRSEEGHRAVGLHADRTPDSGTRGHPSASDRGDTGSKWAWTAASFINFAGPISYFAFGRRT